MRYALTFFHTRGGGFREGREEEGLKEDRGNRRGESGRERGGRKKDVGKKEGRGERRRRRKKRRWGRRQRKRSGRGRGGGEGRKEKSEEEGEKGESGEIERRGGGEGGEWRRNGRIRLAKKPKIELPPSQLTYLLEATTRKSFSHFC